MKFIKERRKKKFIKKIIIMNLKQTNIQYIIEKFILLL